MTVVDGVENLGHRDRAVRLSGGSALTLLWNHRFSRDVTVVVHDARGLAFLAPRHNAVAARLAQSVEKTANTVRMQTACGTIVLMVAGDVVPGVKPEAVAFGPRRLTVDPVEEILAKAILHRAQSFRPCDVFDLAHAVIVDPTAVQRALHATTPMHQILARRLDELAAIDHERALADIGTTPQRVHFDDLIERARRTVREVIREPVGSYTDDGAPCPGFLGLFNAVTNGSRDDITQDDLIALLRGEIGRPSQRRTLFSDVAWMQLASFAAAAGIPKRQVYAAYERARHEVRAANPDIDEAIAIDRDLGLYP